MRLSCGRPVVFCCVLQCPAVSILVHLFFSFFCNVYRVTQEDELKELGDNKQHMVHGQDSCGLDHHGRVRSHQRFLSKKDKGWSDGFLDILDLGEMEAKDDRLERHHHDCLDTGPY